MVHVVTMTDTEAVLHARRLAVLLGHQGRLRPDAVEDVDFSGVLPEQARRAYSVHPLVTGLLDEPGIELHPKWAPNIVTTLGRLGGHRSVRAA